MRLSGRLVYGRRGFGDCVPPSRRGRSADHGNINAMLFAVGMPPIGSERPAGHLIRRPPSALHRD
jgi:hypothetical protein